MQTEIALPDGLSEPERAELAQAEAARARALASDGILVHLWRIPGRRANCGVWRAADATELHEAITSLPMFPYMDITVTPLAAHPNAPR